MKIDLEMQKDSIVTRLNASGGFVEVSIQKRGSLKWITARMNREEALAFVEMLRTVAEQAPVNHA